MGWDGMGWGRDAPQTQLKLCPALLNVSCSQMVATTDGKSIGGDPTSGPSVWLCDHAATYQLCATSLHVSLIPLQKPFYTSSSPVHSSNSASNLLCEVSDTVALGCRIP